MSWASEQVERYRELEPLLDAFVERLHDLLETLFDDEELPFWHSYSWTRSAGRFESALYRALREGRQIGDRLELVGDVAGVVFVGATPADVEAIAAVVERELDVDYAHSLPPAAARAENERRLAGDATALRYEHAGYVASLGESRRRLPEWRAYAGLRVEVHVATISQYAAWSLDSSHVPFFWPSSHPPAAREAYARVAALLASVDEALAGEEDGREGVDAAYAEAFAAGDLDVRLDARALAVYMRHSAPLAELVQAAIAAGMERFDSSDVDPSNRDLEQELLWLLARFHLGTVAELDEFLRSAAPRAREIYRRITDVSSEEGFVPHAVPASMITLLLLVLNRADAETVELVEYREEVETALNTLIGNPVARGTTGEA